MEQLSAALDRLQAALESLEEAAETRLARGDGLADAEGVIVDLRAERNELATELETIRGQAASLEQVNQQVSSRLEGAIAGIREVLEG